jgi:hypothetical protein
MGAEPATLNSTFVSIFKRTIQAFQRGDRYLLLLKKRKISGHSLLSTDPSQATTLTRSNPPGKGGRAARSTASGEQAQASLCTISPPSRTIWAQEQVVLGWQACKPCR